jgi:hypothetical protein
LLDEAGSRNAKLPGSAFTADSAAKQQEATAELRSLADCWLAEVYSQLEMKRQGQRQPAVHSS